MELKLIIGSVQRMWIIQRWLRGINFKHRVQQAWIAGGGTPAETQVSFRE